MDLETGLVSDFDIKKYSLALAPPFKITVNSIKEYFKSGTLAECGANGWAGLEGVGPDNREEMGKIIADKHEDGSTNFSHNTARLKTIIGKCKAKGINVLLVTMPVTAYYADEVNKNKLTMIFNECEKLESENDNVSYINLFYDSRFNNNDFYDVDHLNVKGSVKCSKIINDYLIRA